MCCRLKGVLLLEGKLYLTLKVHGEDVLIDYKNEVVVFPNRPDRARRQLEPERITAISDWLKKEGFLVDSQNTLNKPKQKISSSLPRDQFINKVDPFARVRYETSVGRNRTLIGFDIKDNLEASLAIKDFDIESLGEVEAWGTSPANLRKGWVVYEGFHGKLRDEISLRESAQDQ